MLRYSLDKLKSGLKVIRIPMNSIESLTVLALVNTGSRYEKEKQEGIAHFLEHMIFKGSEKYPDAQTLATAVDSVGANFNAFTSKEYMGFYVKAAAKHSELALDVISDMLLKPKLRQADIEREKKVIIEELNMYVDNPSHHVANLFDNMVYRGSGLSHDIVGRKETIMSFKTNDFQNFLNQFFGLANTVLILSGKKSLVENNKILEELDKFFSKTPDFRTTQDKNLDIGKFLSENPISVDKLHLEYRKTEQAHFVMGWPAIKRKSKKRYALTLLSVILGGNMSSRLFSELREKRGLCYYINSDIDQFHDGGVFGASAGVDVSRVEEAIKLAIAEFAAIADGSKAISDKELRKAKDHLLGKMVLGFEDSEAVAQYFGMKQLLMGQIETPDEVLKKVQAVSKEEIEALAKEIVKPAELRLALIGPFKDRGRFENII
ncbi:MAG: pitrilysin family protein [Candidatus Woesebacteria bacterium]|jgi:predicted Zn-dependent peptidase